jgi:hypothetical protein
MSNYQRAAQFTPFWALDGHKAMVLETERYVDSFTELAGDQQELVDQALRDIAGMIDIHPHVRLTYFKPDLHKQGGQYIDISGRIIAINRERQTLSFEDETTLQFAQIRAIQL